VPRVGLPVNTWKRKLINHPDRAEVDYVIDGITNGFAIGIDESINLGKNRRNLPMSIDEKIHVSEWLLDGLSRGTMWGPFKDEADLPPVLEGIHISPLGAVDKAGGKFRTIHHLSAPKNGNSVNSSLLEGMKEVEYVQFAEVVKFVKDLGVGAYLYLVDAKAAYTSVDIRVEDIKYMAVSWDGLIIVHTTLTYGLSSAPQIYTRFARILKFMTQDEKECFYALIALIYQYLDDFFGGHRSKKVAQEQFNQLLVRG
jgi:hypothetical protein